MGKEMKTAVDTLIEIAESQIGVYERTTNSGPEIDKYLECVGLPPGHPWCAAFTCFAIDLCEQQGHATNFQFSAGVLAMWNLNKLKYKVDRPKRGDVFIMDFGKGKGHTGFVKSVAGFRIITIEGNTNVKGSREGTHVLQSSRDIASINKGFLRPFAT
jgi:hypothetical protein